MGFRSGGEDEVIESVLLCIYSTRMFLNKKEIRSIESKRCTQIKSVINKQAVLKCFPFIMQVFSLDHGVCCFNIILPRSSVVPYSRSSHVLMSRMPSASALTSRPHFVQDGRNGLPLLHTFDN